MLESAITLGLFLGVRHASDVDHVCAIASLLKSGQGLRGALRVALFWSLGHSVTFFAVGLLLSAIDFSPSKPCVYFGSASLRRMATWG